ncbi:hypothetical protein [Dyella sedimenti]|uniref:hypothetical protein n=1 Tax=Dyella sedimenti TaxID=2919947 RepID=UPI001FA96DDA|nr:hypothetical protein [Dyella sedimenti]
MLAIYSLVFAILAWTLLPVMGLVLGPVNPVLPMVLPLAGSVIASISGWKAQKIITASGGLLRGEGLAKAARIMAYTQYSLLALLLLFSPLILSPVLVHHVVFPAPK